MITVEELAGYIPHGLTFKAITGWIFKADSLVMEKADVFAYSESRGGNIGMYALRDNMKPLLHSLDKINEVIVEDGKTLIELISAEVELPFSYESGQLRLEVNRKIQYYSTSPQMWPHWIVQLLYKYHFDVHNLIPRGLAIEKS